ncbi:hypothetical protein [Streptosporangium lutulentum]|uniref:Uncharacterized protein n=1 Tax=Streptosporangium lutulentum TaxID=1461250 RepID=A0ABT9Q8V6_9ACTN|nr:hypothetical protein [Streptosporangium lutulentum]MDP9843163.1 hypothetical protein [Streptosporangium lutulentum]
MEVNRDESHPFMRFFHERRWVGLAVAATGIALLLAVGIPVLSGQGGVAANAVEREPDGSIRIYPRDYKHPEVIEGKLRDFGVESVVLFLPIGKECKEPRAEYAPDNPKLFTSEPPTEGEHAFWRLHPEQIKPGQTLVYSLWYQDDGHGMMVGGRIQVATGPVAPCQIVPGGLRRETGPEGGDGG